MWQHSWGTQMQARIRWHERDGQAGKTRMMALGGKGDSEIGKVRMTTGEVGVTCARWE
jgi:hypothetical protein